MNLFLLNIIEFSEIFSQINIMLQNYKLFLKLQMKSQEVQKILGVTQRTIANYIKSGKLNPIKNGKTHYIYDPKEVYALLGKKDEYRINVTYARVSLPKQKNDLVSQNERLYNFCINKGIHIDRQMQDIKSGMSFSERKSFSELLKLICLYKVDKVIIENKDRLCRFGFELLKEVFTQHGTEIIVISEEDNKTYEQELTDDLISIIHYYSMKSYSHRRKLHAAEQALKSDDERN